jgi:predicted nucleic acid-binding protein
MHIAASLVLIAGAEVFLDTNILIYAALGSVDEPAKYERALELLTRRFGTSGQVLAEFYVNAQRKGARPLTPEKAQEWVLRLSKKPFQPIDYRVVRSGIENAQRYQISYWDGAIIAAAERLGAKILYSEDLSHGQIYGSVRVENPFLPA